MSIFKTWTFEELERRGPTEGLKRRGPKETEHLWVVPRKGSGCNSCAFDRGDGTCDRISWDDFPCVLTKFDGRKRQEPQGMWERVDPLHAALLQVKEES